MAQMPRRVKFRKSQRGKLKGIATRGNQVTFGDFGIQALESGWIKAQQIEAARIAAQRFIGLEGKVFINIFPSKPVSSRPPETRMGKGKGEPSFWVAPVRNGTVMFEVGGVSEDAAKSALNKMAHKLPLKVKLVKRRVSL